MSLQKILDSKRERLKINKNLRSLKELLKIAPNKITERRDFLKAIDNKNRINIIAEFKRASPSRGNLLSDGDPIKVSRIYEENGASGISILTEEDFFLGKTEDLIKAREVTRLPILRKDFIIDEYQIYETASLPADAILLIVKILDPVQLKDFYHLTLEYKITPLIEVHSEKELENAMKLEPVLIGINNRNLETFETDINTTKKLKKLIPDNIIVVAESGIGNRETIDELRGLGINTFLIGESLLTAGDIGKKLKELNGTIKSF